MLPLTAATPSSAWICHACRNSKSIFKPRQRGLTTVIRNCNVSQKLPKTPARTRFAPSPTGYLHLGSLRTALFNYLLAKATGGQFLLRIEDTDQKRTVPGAEHRIIQDLRWLGLQWDEGPETGGPFGPYKQSERTSLYTEHALKLVESGYAYRCFCTHERLHELAKLRNQEGLPLNYDGRCLSIGKAESDDRAACGQSHVIRLKSPGSDYPKYLDLVYGVVFGGNQGRRKIKQILESVDDPIIIKSDGLPTYHLANVVDDHHMKITHVVRAVEWMSSTPKHIHMYNAFGWEPPEFAHVGLLQTSDQQKLSKRNQDTDIESYRKQGILPSALVNFVSLLGWSHNLGSDILTIERLIENFDLKFTKGNTVVNGKKLEYLQKRHARNYIAENGEVMQDMVHRILTHVREEEATGRKCDISKGCDIQDYTAAIFRVDSYQYITSKQYYERIKYFFFSPWDGEEVVDVPSNLRDKHEIISTIIKDFKDVPERKWNAAELKLFLSVRVNGLAEAAIAKELLISEAGAGTELAAQQHRINSVVMSWLRWAVIGTRPLATIGEIMEILGRDTSLQRLAEAESFYSSSLLEAESISAERSTA